MGSFNLIFIFLNLFCLKQDIYTQNIPLAIKNDFLNKKLSHTDYFKIVIPTKSLLTATIGGSTTICSGSSTLITFSSTPNATITYTINNGIHLKITLNNSGSATINTGILTSSVTYSLISVASSEDPTNQVSVNGSAYVSVLVAPTAKISGATTICYGTSVPITFLGTPNTVVTYGIEGIGTRTISLDENGSAVLLTGPIATTTIYSLINVFYPSSPSCLKTLSGSAVVVVNSVTPSVSISASSTSICAGTTANFTATPTNGGTPSYQWQVNGVDVSGATNNTYSSNTFANGDVVRVIMTSTAACATTPTATSNAVTISTNSVTPSVTINPSSTSICAGSTVNFTATPNNGGYPSYQWQVNGLNVGTNAATFSSALLNNGDVVRVIMTSTAACATTSTAASNEVVMTTNSVTPSVSIAASSTSICAGATVNFTANPTNGGTPSYQWQINGVAAGTNASTFSSALLNNGDVVKVIMTSTAACATTSTALSNEVVMTTNSVTPSVTITPSSTSICAGATVNFTANPTNAGSPSYQWQVNGVNVGTNTSTFSSASLNNGDVVRVIMTSTAACATTPNAVSNEVVMTTNSVTPSVSINATSNSICAGATVNFTATPNNGGTPSYQWQVNGLNVGTNAASFSSALLNNGDVVRVIITSTAACATTPTATSNAVTISTNSLTPSVTINPSSTSICAGSTVNFTATPNNGGYPSYQWQVNGQNVGTNAATFSSASLNNGDVVRVIMTSTAACATTSTVVSNEVVMSTNSVTPSVTINPSSSSICAGATVNFTASPNNGGTPSYQWQINGLNVGTNASTFSSASLNNGDVVRVIMTSTAACATTSTAVSNEVVMTTNSVTPSVTINPSSSSICAGATVNFTASPNNGGSPSYQWQVNGLNVGTNAASFSSASLNNGDIVRVIMISTATCASTPTAVSNEVVMTTNTVTPSVSIASSPTSICAGATVNFTAIPVNGGTPSYQWQVNGLNVGTNAASFSSASLNNGDVVRVIMTSTAACATTPTATSNAVTISTNSVTPSVTINPSSTSICAGTTVNFTATPNNGGTPSYQWQVNGVDVSGATNNTFSSNTLANGDIVRVVMTSTAACVTTSTAISNTVTMTTNSLTPSVSINPSSTSICAGATVNFTASPANGGTPSYQWQVNSVSVGTNASTFSSASLNNGDVVRVIMTSTAACATTSTVVSNEVVLTTNSVTPSVSISGSSTSICAGATVKFTATPNNGGFPSYQWQINGVSVGTNAATFSSTSLNNGDVVRVIMTSTAACSTTATAVSNEVVMTTNSVTPSVTINPSSSSICAGATINFTASPNNGGSPSYQWQVNGLNVGTNAASFSSASLNNGDVVRVIMTSTAACATTPTAVSNEVVITTSSVTPSVSINASSAFICAGTTVNFTATTNNGGTPSYQWQINGVDVSGATNNTFSSSTLANGDVVKVVMTSNASCAITPNATSNAVTISTNSVTPSVSISASSTSICAGATVNFTASPNNGSTPSYQWQINGLNVGTNASTFSSSSLNNGDVVRVIMTSTAACATTPTAVSNEVLMTSNSVTPSVTINPTSTSICAGATVNFTASPNNGGSPSYQWQVNGQNVGTNASTFSSASLNNGDVVKVVMTSTASCTTTPNATSNAVTISTNSVTPSVTITSSSTSICAGATVVFNATPTNGGTPSYQWQINGVDVLGATNNTFSSNTLANGDVVRVIMTSTAACVTISTAASNEVVMTTNSVTPSVSIAASSTSICAGATVNFTANPANGGTPSYQWQVNGLNVGTNAASFSSASLNNGDVVRVIMTSTAACVTISTATSNAVTISTNSVTPSVTINPSSTSICAGATVVFNATPTNGGTPSYQWQVNGLNVGTNAASFSSASLNNGDVVRVIMTSTAACATTPTATSNAVTISTNSVTPSVTINPSSTSICAGATVVFNATPTNGGTPSYQWQINGVDVLGATNNTFSSNTLANGDVVSVIMTSTAACVTISTATSNAVTISTNSVTPSVTINPSSTSICAGSTVNFTVSPANGGMPSYQWQVNDVSVGINASTFSSASLNNGDVVRVIMTSTAACATTSTAVSNEVVVTTNSVTPSVTITPSSTSICAGATVNFTATPVNGGTPSYQWQVNGVAVGTNAASFSSASLNNGDIVRVIMISTATCATTSTALSNEVVMTTNSVKPSVTITSSSTSICVGATVNFTATPVNGGTPSYQWQVNGLNVGTNAASFSSASLNNGDVVRVIMTSTAACATTPTAVSNEVVMTTNSVTPSVTINPSSNSICAGATVNFTANPTNAGSPSYQWQVNGVNVGTNTSTFSSASLNNGDVVRVIMTSTAACATIPTAVSNEVVLEVFQKPGNFLPADTSICPNETIEIKPITSYRNYLWSDGSVTSNFTATRPGYYTLQVVDVNGCTGTDGITIFSKECQKGFYAPSGFTPNGDGKNDVFKPLLFGNVIQYELVVYNRWGQIIFKSNDHLKGWNGSRNGSIQKADVFVWICRYQFEGEEKRLEKGTVVLIK